MGEVIPFPAHNTQAQNKGELGAHFESQIEAAAEVQQEVSRNKSWFEVHFRMTPPELVEYFNQVRDQIVDINEDKSVPNANVIPYQKQTYRAANDNRVPIIEKAA